MIQVTLTELQPQEVVEHKPRRQESNQRSQREELHLPPQRQRHRILRTEFRKTRTHK